MARTSAFARHAPLLACLVLAVWMFYWQPPRAVSAMLVVLAYLGVCLHVYWRHRRNLQIVAPPQPDALLIVYASQGGTARALAERSAEQLHEAGVEVGVARLGSLEPAALASRSRLLFIVSTYGEGEAPDSAAHFDRLLSRFKGDLSGLEFALLALGDRQYSHFCGFGRRLDARLQKLGARPLFDRLDVDRADAGALRHWQQQLAHLSGNSQFVDWQPAIYQPWRLHRRELLNEGSLGSPVFRVTLRPAGDIPRWQAGDIAEIGPRHAPAMVEQLLVQAGFDPAQAVAPEQSLAAALSDKRLPADPQALRGMNLDALLALPPLPHREYTIASVPSEDCIELLVRQAHYPDGRLGLGSGWLCRHAAPGYEIDLRVRTNPGFHGPQPQVPLILIGNGTGLAGLCAHLRERAETGGSRNWLLYGERSVTHDWLLQDELQTWLDSGHLQRLDLAFSRDQAERVYVQHRLRDAADELRRWVSDGAAIYVCGSLEGMGRDVQQVLAGLLGEAQLQKMGEQGRYRRDLY